MFVKSESYILSLEIILSVPLLFSIKSSPKMKLTFIFFNFIFLSNSKFWGHFSMFCYINLTYLCGVEFTLWFFCKHSLCIAVFRDSVVFLFKNYFYNLCLINKEIINFLKSNFKQNKINLNSIYNDYPVDMKRESSNVIYLIIVHYEYVNIFPKYK